MTKFNSEVLLVSYYDFPFYAGISKRIEGMLHVLTHHNVFVSILSPLFHRDKPFCSNKYRWNIEYVDLRWLRALGHESKPVKFLAALIFSFLAFLKIARKKRQYYLIQYQTMYSAIPAILAKIFLKATVIGDDIGLLHTNRQPPYLWILRAIDMAVLKFTDIVITFSLVDYKFIKQKFKSKKILLIPNGVIVSPVKTLIRKKRVKILLFIGNLTFTHNLIAVNNIIKIAECLAKRRKDFKMLIVGGPLSNVSHLMKHRMVQMGIIRFLGYVSEEVLKDISASAYIGLLPFFHDTPHFGQRTKALEYFANGLLVVSGPEGVKGIRGLEAEKHYLVANSLDEMCKIIEMCLSEPEKYQKIATTGARYISEYYSWENLTKDYINLIRNLLFSKDT